MKRGVCLWCGGRLKGLQTKFCCPSHIQKMRYALHKQEISDRAAVWAKKNPEKYRATNRIAVNKYLMTKRLRFNKLCYLNYYKRKVARLEQELAQEKESV